MHCWIEWLFLGIGAFIALGAVTEMATNDTDSPQ